MIGPPPVRLVSASAPQASPAVSSQVTCAGVRARRICYDQSAVLHREDDHREESQPDPLHREEDQREEDQREEDQRDESQPALLQREDDQREELRPPEAGSQLSPVQVTPSH